jgi:hypothetical protein
MVQPLLDLHRKEIAGAGGHGPPAQLIGYWTLN